MLNKAETRYLIITLGILLIGMLVLGVMAIIALPARANPIGEPIVYLWNQYFEPEIDKFKGLVKVTERD